MPKRTCLALWMMMLGVVIGFTRPTLAGTFTVADRNELLVLTSQLQAAQFLTHATFGPSQATIDALALRMRTIGTLAAASEWIDQQTDAGLSKSLHLPTAEAYINEELAFCTATTSALVPISPLNASHAVGRTNYRHHAWFNHAIQGPDQLRQRTAWALSQIIAVGSGDDNFTRSNLETAGGIGPNGAVPQKPRYLGQIGFYDIFVDNAFGSYLDILKKVTYHPIMGDWLSSRGNAKANVAANQFPDENYAREVMQLFSIGLAVLNPDGSEVLDVNGEAIPTYTQDTIRELAKVFTGLGYNGTGGAYNTTGNTSGFQTGIRYSTPMTMASSQHDVGAKSILGTNLPAIATNRTACDAEVANALTILFNHQSCGPFICHRLIQRLVKSNPSRAYMSRVVAKFHDNGSGARGDLKAVVRAILLDPEAWQPIRTQYLRNPNRILVTTMGTEDSRLQEPVVNYTRVIRALKGAAIYEKGTTALNTAVPPTGVVTTYETLSNDFRLQSRFNEFDQSPYQTPSVFNFYLADYQPAGDLANYNPSSRIPLKEIATPEFQIVNAISANRSVNLFRGLILNGINQSQLTAGTFNAGNPSAVPPVEPFVAHRTSTNNSQEITTMLNSTRCRVVLDAGNGFGSLSTQANLALVMPGTATGPAKLIENIDLLLCQGTMNESYRNKLMTVLANRRSAFGATVDTSEALTMARSALISVVSSPSFLVSK
jgi:uncharacterized protein (DUF1800 family)